MHTSFNSYEIPTTGSHLKFSIPGLLYDQFKETKIADENDPT